MLFLKMQQWHGNFRGFRGTTSEGLHVPYSSIVVIRFRSFCPEQPAGKPNKCVWFYQSTIFIVATTRWGRLLLKEAHSSPESFQAEQRLKHSSSQFKSGRVHWWASQPSRPRKKCYRFLNGPSSPPLCQPASQLFAKTYNALSGCCLS